MEELRQCPRNGKYYPKRAFLKFFGGYAEWDSSEHTAKEGAQRSHLVPWGTAGSKGGKNGCKGGKDECKGGKDGSSCMKGKGWNAADNVSKGTRRPLQQLQHPLQNMAGAGRGAPVLEFPAPYGSGVGGDPVSSFASMNGLDPTVTAALRALPDGGVAIATDTELREFLCKARNPNAVIMAKIRRGTTQPQGLDAPMLPPQNPRIVRPIVPVQSDTAFAPPAKRVKVAHWTTPTHPTTSHAYGTATPMPAWATGKGRGSASPVTSFAPPTTGQMSPPLTPPTSTTGGVTAFPPPMFNVPPVTTFPPPTFAADVANTDDDYVPDAGWGSAQAGIPEWAATDRVSIELDEWN